MTMPTQPPNPEVSYVDPDPNVAPGHGPKNSVKRGNVEVPVVTLGATATTGGTFSAGAYFWVVTAVNANGETTRSNQVTATLALNGTQTITWTNPAGDETSYRIYRSTATNVYPASALVGTVAVGTTTFTDTGAAATVGTPPAANTATQASVSLTGEKFAGLTDAQKTAAGLEHYTDGSTVNMTTPTDPGVSKPANQGNPG